MTKKPKIFKAFLPYFSIFIVWGVWCRYGLDILPKLIGDVSGLFIYFIGFMIIPYSTILIYEKLGIIKKDD